ncbi:MAG: energy transducer TonB [Candidatus Acidiferrum sp.]
MQINNLLRTILALLAVSPCIPSVVMPQANSASSATPTTAATRYSDTTDGLQRLLQDTLAAAKSGDREKVAAFVKDMEIPDCDAWLHKMYESDKADSWMGLCDAKVLAPREQWMQELFMRLAKEEGEVLTRKVNDNPEPGHGLEWGWLGSIRQPLDIYFANWKLSNAPSDYERDPIGYFMFIDGGFRWESTIVTLKPSETKHAKIVVQKLIRKVAPVYPPEAASRGISGTVRVHFVIGEDGIVYNAHAISGEGLSEDPLLRKAAEEAVLQWRYEPATLVGKPIQIDATADVIFSQKN